MAQTTTAQGRLQVLTPDQNYDTVIDGGNALFAAINAAFTKISDNIVSRWSNDIVLASGGTTTYTHNFGQALTQLKVLVFVSNALLPKATQDLQFTISQSSTNVISIANISGSDKTFQLYVLAFPLSVRTADIDASIDAVVTRLEFTGGVLFDEIATPATPSSGKVAIYAKNDKKLYTLNSLGTEVQVGAGAGGSGKNYLSTYSDFSLDPSTGMVNNLTATGNRGSNTTVWGANTTSLLSQTSTALRDTTSAQLVNGSSASNFIESPLFTLETIDVNTNQLFISFDMNSAGSAVATNDWLLQVIRYNSSGVFQENITPSITSVPSGYYQFKCAFNHSATATDQYAIRFRSNTATARTLTIDTLVVGPQAVISSAAIGAWLAWTPTITGFGTVTGLSAFYRRVGDSMQGQVFFTGGTIAASLASVSLPTNLNIDSSKINATSTAAVSPKIGEYSAHNANNSGPILAAATTSTTVVYFGGGYSTGGSELLPQLGTGVTASTISVALNFTIPISQWTANVTLAGNPNIEYAFNTSTTDASDTTSFGYGASGIQGVFNTTSLTSIRNKRIRFQTAIQPTDRIQIEISTGGGKWNPLMGGDFSSGLLPLVFQSANGYGMGLNFSNINTTDVDVTFGQYAAASGATFSSVGTLWSSATYANYKWRVAKYSGVGPAEIAPATATSPGTVSGGTVPGSISGSAIAAGYLGEQVISTVTSGSFASAGVNADATSISLSPGVWDISATLVANNNGATSVGYFRIGISTSPTTGFADEAAGLNSILFRGTSSSTGNVYSSGTIPKYRKAVSATTTMYLKTLVETFATATPSILSASIFATRVG